jgi:hypothetical protein
MKRYFAFYGYQYYPHGGMADFIGDFDTFDDCMSAIVAANERECPDEPLKSWDWYQIWDSETRVFIENTHD